MDEIDSKLDQLLHQSAAMGEAIVAAFDFEPQARAEANLAVNDYLSAVREFVGRMKRLKNGQTDQQPANAMAFFETWIAWANGADYALLHMAMGSMKLPDAEGDKIRKALSGLVGAKGAANEAIGPACFRLMGIAPSNYKPDQN